VTTNIDLGLASPEVTPPSTDLARPIENGQSSLVSAALVVGLLAFAMTLLAHRKPAR
jgi:hypothetical protein